MVKPGGYAYGWLKYSDTWSDLFSLQISAICENGVIPNIFVSNSAGSTRPGWKTANWRSGEVAQVKIPQSDPRFEYNPDSLLYVSLHNQQARSANCSILPLFDAPVREVTPGKPITVYAKGHFLTFFTYTYTTETVGKDLTVNLAVDAGPGWLALATLYASFSSLRPSHLSYELTGTSDDSGNIKLIIPASSLPKVHNPVLYLSLSSIHRVPFSAKFNITVA